MNSICLFASYFNDPEIPYYVRVYLQELRRHYSRLILITSGKELSGNGKNFLKEQHIELQTETNEGFDFGMWYKALQKNDVTAFDQLVLVNDSCILFRPLDEFVNWSGTNPAELQGMTLSDAIAPHVQSYFLVINKKAIPHMLDYLNRHKIIRNLGDVIRTYEVGLSSYLLGKGQHISTYIDNNGYSGEFSPYYHCIKHHIAKGIPLIKKKILFASYRKDELFTLARMNFKISPVYYITLIRATKARLILDFDRLERGSEKELGLFDRIQYFITRTLITIFRPIRKLKNG